MAASGIFNVSRDGFKYGRTRFAARSNRMATAPEITHDGDTVSVSSADNLGIRFLGIDTAEISYDFPGKKGFLGLGNQSWEEFFTGPELQKKMAGLSKSLAEHLWSKIGDGKDVAPNHFRHASAARQRLLSEITNDMALCGKTNADFHFFLAYGFEFLDSYGRLLCYLRPHRDNFEGDVPETANKDYNLRQLENGTAVPYFIFPNVDPFLRIFNPLDKSIITPAGFWNIMAKASKLKAARQAVKIAREQGKGIFDAADPLRILPMELRSISKGSKPNRYVIDLSQPGTDTLLDPELYFTIPNVEDRMYIPGNFGEYFQLAGWNLLRSETYTRLVRG